MNEAASHHIKWIQHHRRETNNEKGQSLEVMNRQEIANSTTSSMLSSTACIRVRLQQARSLWLSARDAATMQQVEHNYRSIWEELSKSVRLVPNHDDPGDNIELSGQTMRSRHANCNDPRKRPRLLDREDGTACDNEDFMTDPLYSEMRKQAGEKLAFLCLQSGRYNQADEILHRLGYVCRLAGSILDYPSSSTSPPSSERRIASVVDKTSRPCRIWDHFLNQQELQLLTSVFVDRESSFSYWKAHSHYQVEPPSPYFSYVIPIDAGTSSSGAFGALLAKIQALIAEWKPRIQVATACELWAHHRPHATGHQLHFDSDNEGDDGIIRNPIATAVLYLPDDDDDDHDDGNNINDNRSNPSASATKIASASGGPTLVTTQRLHARTLANVRGYLCAPCPGRMVVLDGKVLHGVIPGRGHGAAPDGRTVGSRRHRVSLMIAFWREIVQRGELDRNGAATTPGAARPFPYRAAWAQHLMQSLPGEQTSRKIDDNDDGVTTGPLVVEPTVVEHVYECVSTDMNGHAQPWLRSMGMPDYEQVYQGF